MNKKFRTDFLFASSSFLRGMGSILGVFNSYYEFNESASGERADYAALKSDFGVVGCDIYESLEKGRL